MTITKDVIHDLMPLYLAGEASADTRRLIDEYLQANPAERPLAGALSLPPAPSLPDTEATTLLRTREVYRRRATALAGALALSYAVFSFVFDSSGLRFLVVRDMPALAWALLAAAAGVWVHFFDMHRQWVRTGLVNPSPAHTGLWLGGGVLAAIPFAFVVTQHFGAPELRLPLCLAGAFLARAIGRALHRSATAR